jgi:hypothetical protein
MQAAPSGAGVGLEKFIGTGAGTQAAQVANGIGLVSIAVTGTGAGTQVPASAYGTGIGGLDLGGRGGKGPRRLAHLDDEEVLVLMPAFGDY